MRHYTGSNGVAVSEFAWTDLVRAWRGEFVQKQNKALLAKHQAMYHLADHGPKWYGGLRSPAEADTLAIKGWPEGTAMVQAAMRGLPTPTPESVRRVMQWSDVDGEANSDRYLAGEDRFLRRSQRASRRGPRTITLWAEIGGNWERTADQLLWSAVQACALVDTLENAGYRVEVNAVWPGRRVIGDHQSANVIIRVKEALDHLRMDNVVAMLGHAGLLRTIGFSCICSHDGKVSDTLGRQAGMDQVVTNPGDIVLSAALSQAEAVANLMKTLAALAEPAAA